MKLMQLGSWYLEFRVGAVRTTVLKERHDAVARTFDVENLQRKPTTRLRSMVLYQMPVLQARAMLGALCLGGSYYTRAFAGTWLWRIGHVFIIESVTRAAAEIVWHLCGLDRLSAWQGLLEMHLRDEMKDREEYFRQSERQRQRKQILQGPDKADKGGAT
jgi:hypothetical protein